MGHRRALALAVALTVAAAMAVGGGAAYGHGETTPVIRTIVDGFSTPVKGVGAQIVSGLPTDVSMINTSATDLVVTGDLKEPFLRIGPSGVYANVNSPTWYGSGNPDGIALNLPRSARKGAVPRWQRVSKRPQWSWFDRRVQPAGVTVPPQARQGRRPLRLIDWAIPLVYGGRALSLHGHVEYRPPIGMIVPAMRSPSGLAPGVQVGLLDGAAPGLFLENSGPATVTVLGSDGQPFARIGPRGVDVNSRSATYAAQAADTRGAPPTRGAPGWRHVADVPRYGWVDPRMRYGSLDPPPDVARQDHSVVLRRWSVPVETAAGRRLVSGATSWVPILQPGVGDAGGAGGSHASGLLTWLLVSGALAALGALVALGLRRRQPESALPAG